MPHLQRQNERSLSGRAFVLEQLRQIDVDAQVRQFLMARELPKLEYHFEKHGDLLNCDSIKEYALRFHHAIRRTYTEMYVLRQSITRPVLMWYAIDKFSQEVIQFNQQTGQPFSFYQMNDWRRFVEESLAVVVVLQDDVWKVET